MFLWGFSPELYRRQLLQPFLRPFAVVVVDEFHDDDSEILDGNPSVLDLCLAGSAVELFSLDHSCTGTPYCGPEHLS